MLKCKGGSSDACNDIATGAVMKALGYPSELSEGAKTAANMSMDFARTSPDPCWTQVG